MTYIKVPEELLPHNYAVMEPPKLTVNQLISELEFLRDNYGEGETHVAVGIPGESGFTTLDVHLAYPALILDRDRGKAVAIIARDDRP